MADSQQIVEPPEPPPLPASYNDVSDDEESLTLLRIAKVILSRDLKGLQNAIYEKGLNVNQWYRTNPDTLKRTLLPGVQLSEAHPDDKIQILHFATCCRWAEGVDELLKAGAEVNSFDNRAPHISQSEGQLTFEQIITGSSYTPLMHACCYGSVPQVKVLLNHGADPSVIDPQSGVTPMYLVMKFFSYPILKLLLDKGVELTKMDASSIPLQDIIDVLWSRPSLNITNAHQCSKEQISKQTQEIKDTALYLAEKFLRNGADPNVTQVDKLPALHLCAEGWNEDMSMLELLVESGADVNLLCKGLYYHKFTQMSPLLAALLAEKGHAAMRFLIQHGADVGQRFTRYYRGRAEGDPISLLSIAIKEGLDQNAWLLIKAGCDVTKQDVRALRALLAESKETDIGYFNETGQHIPYMVTAIENIEAMFEFLAQPQDLKWLIRKALRTKLHVVDVEGVNALPLPRAMKDFILCHDL